MQIWVLEWKVQFQSPGSSQGSRESLTLVDGDIGSVLAEAPKVFNWEPLLVC